MFEFLLQVANSTMPVINIPATLTPIFEQPVAATAASAADPLGIVALVSMALAAFNTYQSKKNDTKQSGRANALADTQIEMAGSLKATDMGTRDLAMGVKVGFDKLAENPTNAEALKGSAPQLKGTELLDFIKQQADGWDQSIRDYYQSLPPKPSEFSKDPVIAKTAAVQKMSEPNASM